MERDLQNERIGSMFLRFILYSVIAYFVIRFIKSFISGASRVKPVSGPDARQGVRKTVAATMIRCESCGTFITENSALHSGNQLFCSNSCAKVGVQRT
jgi:hypothetical protein